MAEQRCPMCGKPNPEELEICQYCQARLKPLTAPLGEPIRPGDEPVKKSTSELERALPEWLRKARHPASDTTADQPPETGELPLSKPASQVRSEKPAPSQAADLLSGLISQSTDEEEEIPEWLANLSGGTPTSKKAEPEPQLPDWLSDSSGQAEQETLLPLSGKADELPPESESGQSAFQAAETEQPDWMVDLKSEAALSGLEVGAETGVSDELPGSFDLPDWLAGLSAEEKPAAEAPAAPAAEGELPDWLAGLSAEEKPAAEAPAAPAAEGELPDWLAALKPEAAVTPGEEEPASVPAEPQELPNWLTSLPAAETSVEATLPPFADQSPPVETPPSAFVEAPNLDEAEAAFSMELPDWLASVVPEKPQVQTGDSAAAEEEAILPGSLPSWVQAMRPVEAVVPEAGAETVEEDVVTEGPLAGLRNVLPAGPAFMPGRKPQVFGLKLQAEEEQQANAVLLQKMLEAESEPKSLTSPPLLLSERVLRWVLLALFLLVVGLPLFARRPFTPQASLFPNETLAAVQAINALPENAPVLLVFDYDAGLSGELEVAAAPLVDHLMLRGARLTLLATTPGGSLLAERFLTRTQAEHRYQPGFHYVNLGYLPGGAAGVSGFAQSPVRAMPAWQGGESAWQMSVLQGVRRLSDFEAVVVLSDNTEGAQTWVEQALPWLEDKPLLLVVSAQVEPVLRPYVDSGQVKGLVSGLTGGVAYEAINGRPGLAQHYRDSLSIGLFLTAIVLVIGGGWSLLSARRVYREKTAGEV